MGTLAICPWSRVRTSTVTREIEALRPAEAPKRQARDESPFTHQNAAQALVLAASPITEDTRGRQVVAVVLDDGTVVAGGREAGTGRRWANGKVAGRDWTLWWERRAQISGL